MIPTSTIRKKAGFDAVKKRDKDRSPFKAALSKSSGSSSTSSTPKSIATTATRAAAPGQSNFPLTSGPITLDLHRFADDSMNPEEFVQRSLTDTNEEGIRSFHHSLVDAKQTIGGDLQRNVYRNYTEFVLISKEVSNLDTDVLQLKGYLNELRSIWENLLEDSSVQDDVSLIGELDHRGMSQRNKRNDMKGTDLQSIYRAQITALWDNVEGSQRFVPYAPGRHIIRECVNFLELNSKTLQPRQAVHLFLLNDCLLIASRKKRSAAAKYKLFAECCWSLQDVTIVDLKDAPNLMNAVKISVYPNTFLFRSERPEDKIALLIAYKRAMDDQGDQHEDQPKKESSNRDERNGDGQEVQVNPKDRDWLSQLPDELEVAIALRQFENAVSLIEKAQNVLAGYPRDVPLIQESRTQLQYYTNSLSSCISHDLENTLLTKLQFQRLVNWLLRLDKGEEAREVFLSTRSQIIKKRIRQLTFEGDSITYINELALVVFTLIRNTCEWYRDSFKQNEMASRFITWVREQTETFAEIYKRQVFNHSQLNCQLIADCFKSTVDQCAMLRKVGLDLKFLLEDFFLDNIRETIMTYEKQCNDNSTKFVKNDDFRMVSSQNLGNDVRVSSSVVNFYNMLVKFVNDICLIAKLQLYETVVRSISRVTEHYLRTMVEHSKGQRSIAVMNVGFVLDNIVPRVSSQLNRHFDRPVPELDSLRARLRSLGN